MVNMNKFRYLRIFTLGLHSYINRTFHPVAIHCMIVTDLPVADFEWAQGVHSNPLNAPHPQVFKYPMKMK